MSDPGEQLRQRLGDELQEEIRLSRERFEANLPPGPRDPTYVGPTLKERSLAETRRLMELGRRAYDNWLAEQPAPDPPYPELTD